MVPATDRLGRDIDLSDPAQHAKHDLGAFWRQLRHEAPVAWHPLGQEPGGFWVVSTHRAAIEVYRDSDRFTSRHGNVLATLLNGGDSAGGLMLAVSDGPRHQEIRRELLRSFSHSALAPIRERTTAAVRSLVRRAVAAGTCDFASEVAARIPLAAICDLLEVPEERRDFLYSQASKALAADAPFATDEDARLARNEILLLFAQIVRGRRSTPSEDTVLGSLLRLTGPPLRLTTEELLFNCYSLLLGGDETTRLTMIGTVREFAADPVLWHRLRDGEVSVGTAVDELLRWTTPAMHGGRTATQDTVLEGRRIAAGDLVVVWNNSANFDEAQFTEPDRLDLGRTPNRHLAFAHGPHYCLGVALAKIELTALLEALVEQVDDITLTGEPKRIYSNFLSGYHSLPVRLTARAEVRRGP
ncbi:cytochrome P450 [Streptomyces goshikiensis]|uniref:cytochrome P450 n=1 Tax=Streptomyces goshikiensis TaxID=1942 RepID=UPI0036C40683